MSLGALLEILMGTPGSTLVQLLRETVQLLEKLNEGFSYDPASLCFGMKQRLELRVSGWPLGTYVWVLC